MKKSLIFAALLFFALLSHHAQAQENKPVVKGDGSGTCSDCARFESPRIYLEKSESRIIRLEASFFEYKLNDQKHSKALINIHFYAPKFSYFDLVGENRFDIQNKNLIIITADKVRITPKSIAYFNFRERLVSGEKKGFISFKPQIKDGKILDEKGIEVIGMLGEQFSVSYEPDEFKKFAAAKKIVIEIDNKTFELNKEQVKEIANIAQKASIK